MLKPISTCVVKARLKPSIFPRARGVTNCIEQLREQAPRIESSWWSFSMGSDLMGHDVNVNLNVYTQTPIETKLEAVDVLAAFVNLT